MERERKRGCGKDKTGQSSSENTAPSAKQASNEDLAPTDMHFARVNVDF